MKSDDYSSSHRSGTSRQCGANSSTCSDLVPANPAIERHLKNCVTKTRKGCVIWIGTQDEDGYGRVQINRQKWRTHRLSWALHNGPIPDGAVVRHTCDRPACVNHEHLKMGTQAENIADRERRGRGRIPVRARGVWTGKIRRTG